MKWEVKIPIQKSPLGPLFDFFEQSCVLAKGVFGLFEACLAERQAAYVSLGEVWGGRI